MRFWDTSAIVPLFVKQKQTPQAERWFAEDPALVVWRLTSVEIASALRRLEREGALPKAADLLAEATTLLWESHVIEDVGQTEEQALRLLRIHPLRAADALQLGAALVWAGGAGRGKHLHTFDGALAEAARREGFRTA